MQKFQELKENLKLFSPSQEAFKSLSEQIERMVATALLEISRKIIKETQGQDNQKQVQAIVSQVTERLEESTAQAEATLAQVQKALSLKSWLTWLASLLAVIIVALSINYFYLARIESLTTRQLVKTYKYGLLLKEIWPKLSKQDQAQLSCFLEDKDYQF